LVSVFIGLMMRVFQWSVIKGKLGKNSRHWVIVTWAGYLLTVAVSVVVFGPLERVMQLRPGFTEYDRIVIIVYLYWFIEALIVGSLQSFVLSESSKTGWGWVFILGFSITLEFLIVNSTIAMAIMLIGPSLWGLAIVILAVSLSIALSGGWLAWLLKTTRKESDAGL
jgi:hypothetical protein